MLSFIFRTNCNFNIIIYRKKLQFQIKITIQNFEYFNSAFQI